MRLQQRSIAVVLTALGTVVGSLVLGSAPAQALEPRPSPSSDCTLTATPLTCVAIFSPTSPKAGEVVTVTKDGAASSGIYKDFTTVALSQGTPGTPGYVRIQVYVNTEAADNNSGTFVMPVLPASGTWNVDVNSSGDPQGFGQLTYGGAGEWTCAVGFSQVVADSTKLCEKRFTASGSLTVPADVASMQFLVVGGGGGGGGALNDMYYDSYGAGSGGGGGAVKTCTISVTPAESWVVTVGTGGLAGATRSDSTASPGSGYGLNGGESSIVRTSPAADCTAAGGLGGGEADGIFSGGPERTAHVPAQFATLVTPTAGAGGASGSGNLGGDGFVAGDHTVNGGGGGGAGTSAVGGDATSPAAGVGGAGVYPSGWFADFSNGLGGGGGGGSFLGTGGAGSDGGGNGTTCDGNVPPSCGGGDEASSAANAPAANSGGGGGGGAAGGPAAAGADGIVIARYGLDAPPPPPAEPSDPGVWIEGQGTETCADYATITAAVVAAIDNDIIHICPGLYQEAEIVVADANLTFVGEGATRLDVIVDGSKSHRVFEASAKTVTFENLTIQNGYLTTGNGAGVLASKVITDNAYFTNNWGTSDTRGGAIYADSVSLVDSGFTLNGGNQLFVYDFQTGPIEGGAVYLAGSDPSVITGTAFRANQVKWGETGRGSAVFSIGGSITVTDSFFAFNDARHGDGSITYDPSSGGTLTITETTFFANWSGHGAGVWSSAPTTVTASTFLDNYVDADGAAIHAEGSLTIDSSDIVGNYGFAYGGTATRGTIFSTADAGSGDDVVITNSTFTKNARFVAGTVIDAAGNVRLEYVTVVGNVADIVAENEMLQVAGDLTIVNSLISGNVEAAFGNLDEAGTPLPVCAVQGTLVASGSVSDESSCGITPTVDPMGLLEVQYFGDAETYTIPLTEESPAVGAAVCADSDLTVDQNGAARPGADGLCDAGAFEFVTPTGTEVHECPADGATTTVGIDPTTGYPICQRVFDESAADSEFVPPAGITSVDVVLAGGGGGGGGGGTDATGDALLAGGGGAGGSVVLLKNQVVVPYTPVAIGVGAGGDGGAAATLASPTGDDGEDGGSSSFGSASTDGGQGGRGAGVTDGVYRNGSGGSTPAGGTGSIANVAFSGGAGAANPAWNTSYYYSAGGGGAGAGLPGSAGLFGPQIGNLASTAAGMGGFGFLPVDSSSLFASRFWADSLGAGTFGFGPGGAGGLAGVTNDDVYSLLYGATLDLFGIPTGGNGGQLAAVLDPGVYTRNDPTFPKPFGGNPVNTVEAYGGGGGGAIGYFENAEFSATASSGRSGAVIVRYTAGPVPECGVDSGTATTSSVGGGIQEMVITSKCNFVAPDGVDTIDVVAIGGGGGGGYASSYAGGGGGGGEVALCADVSVASSNLVLANPGDAGAGGTGDASATDGGESVFSTDGSLCSAVGGKAGAGATQFWAGAGGDSGQNVGGTPSAAWYFTTDTYSGEFYSAAGGGGAGASSAGTSPSCPGYDENPDVVWGPPLSTDCGSSTGGDGAALNSLIGASASLFATATDTYGGGGAGGNNTAGTNDANVKGGAGGGGNGASVQGPGANATAYGGGGGGALGYIGPFSFGDGRPVRKNPTDPTGNGYQGAVIVRWKAATPAVYIEGRYYDGISLTDSTTSTNGDPETCENTPYDTITDAVAAASANDIVHVCPGTYREEEIVVSDDNLTIVGDGKRASSVRIDGQLDESDSSTRHRIFDASGLTISFRNVRLQNGESEGNGAAVTAAGVVVEDSAFYNNSGDFGAAIFVSGCGSTAPIGRLFPGVTACDAPIGPRVGPVIGEVSITSSTFFMNSAASDGGAVYNAVSAGSTTIVNSTFVGNDAATYGGAVYSEPNLTLSFSTFSDNTADTGGIYAVGASASVTLDNNIFEVSDNADRVGAECFSANAATDTGSLTTVDLAFDGCPGDVETADALDLQPLADNGGPTNTMALTESSAAVDDAEGASCDALNPKADQRGIARPVGGSCDVGAFEYFGSITLETDPGEYTLTVPEGIESIYFTLVGGGGGGGAANGGAGGGGGGGEVVFCTINDLTTTSLVEYKIAAGGAEGESGEDAWVKLDGNEVCSAAGGLAGIAGDINDGTGGDGGSSGGTSPNAGGAGSNYSATYDIVFAGGGGGGAGGAGAAGAVDAITDVATGGAGGDGVAPAGAAFGDSSVRYGGGGGGGAVTCTGFGTDTAGGAGGVGGGASGASEEINCSSNRPVTPRVTDPVADAGTDGAGGGGGGGAGTIEGGPGGAGGAQARTPAAGGNPLHVCVKKLYVIYGAKYYNPEPFLCVPVTDPCADAVDPTAGSPALRDPECCPSVVAPATSGSVSATDPECCPTAPVGGSDPNHCDIPASAESLTDGYATLVGDTVLDEGQVSELSTAPVGDEELSLPTPQPLHYEHGLPDGWRKASLDEFPGVELPTCTTEYEPGTDVTDPSDPSTWLPITCEGGEPLDYEFDYEFIDGLRIYPAVLKVKPKHLRVPYLTDPADIDYEYTIRGFKLGEDSSVLTDTPTCTSGYFSGADAGSKFDIICSEGAATNYEFRYQNSHVHVDKVRVPLLPVSQVVTYGDPRPAYSFRLSDLRSPESALSPERLAGFVAPLCTSAYTPSTATGTLDISCVGAASLNYEFVPSKGTLTVRKAALLATPRDAVVTYGSSSPSVGFDLEGFVNEETLGSISGYRAPSCTAPAYTPTTAAGSSLTVSCVGGSARNYDIGFSGTSTLTVARAVLTVVPDAKPLTYGQSVPIYTASVTGWRNGESALSNPGGFTMPVCGSAYGPLENVGTVTTITCSGGSARDYFIDTSPSAAVTVSKATLLVAPDTKTVTYGQAAPVLTWTVTGFRNGQSGSDAAGYVAPSCTSTYTTLSNAGSVPITCTGGTASNYQFVHVAGQIVVNKATLRAVPANATVVYGQASAPNASVAVTGFLNGQLASTATGYKAPVCRATTYLATSNVGTLPITCSGGSATNYVFDTSATSLLSITKAVATVTAEAKSVTYGSAAPSYTFTLSGLKNGQTSSTIAGLVPPTCSSVYSPTSAVGTAPAITCAGGSSTNYSFTYAANKVAITKATLTVTPNNFSILMGSAIPVYSFVVSGFVNGQTAGTAGSYTAPKCTSSYTTKSTVGTYTINCSGGSASNYGFSYRSGTVTVR